MADVHLAALSSVGKQMEVLKGTGAMLWTDQTTMITLPEGGIYCVFAHNSAGWASARIVVPSSDGQLAVWRDASTDRLVVRITVPSQISSGTKLALLMDGAQIAEQELSKYGAAGTGYDASFLSADSKTLWLSIPVVSGAK